MTYTINEKQYTEFDINKQCAELLGSKSNKSHHNAGILKALRNAVLTDFGVKDYCNNPADTWPIIDKCWDELNESILRNGGRRRSHWQYIIKKHNCTKLVAACITFIAIRGAK